MKKTFIRKNVIFVGNKQKNNENNLWFRPWYYEHRVGCSA